MICATRNGKIENESINYKECDKKSKQKMNKTKNTKNMYYFDRKLAITFEDRQFNGINEKKKLSSHRLHTKQIKKNDKLFVKYSCFYTLYAIIY